MNNSDKCYSLIIVQHHYVVCDLLRLFTAKSDYANNTNVFVLDLLEYNVILALNTSTIITSPIVEESHENVTNMPILCPSPHVMHTEEFYADRIQSIQPSTPNNKTCTIEDKMIRKWMITNIGATLTGIYILLIKRSSKQHVS